MEKEQLSKTLNFHLITNCFHSHPLHICLCVCIRFWRVLWWLISCRFACVGSKPSFFSWQSELGGGDKKEWPSLQTSYSGYSTLFSVPFSFFFHNRLQSTLSVFQLVIFPRDFGEMAFVDLDILSHMWLVLILVN